MKIKAGAARPAARSAKPAGAAKAATNSKTFTLDAQRPPQASRAGAPPGADAARAAAPREGATPTMPRALRDLEQQRKRIDKLLAQAARGRDFSPQQLLRLQATVYRYGQDLEVLSRVVDKTVGALKQTLNTQV